MKFFTANEIYGNNTSLRNNLLTFTERYGEIKLTGLTKKQRYEVYCTMSYPLSFKKIGGTRNQDKDILVNNKSIRVSNNNDQVQNQVQDQVRDQDRDRVRNRVPNLENEINKNIVRIHTNYIELFEVHKRIIWALIVLFFIDTYVNCLEIYYRHELTENVYKYKNNYTCPLLEEF